MSGKVEIRPATPTEIKEFYHGIRVQEIVDAFGAFADDECLGIGGTIRDPSYFGTLWEEDGRMIGFLDVRKKTKNLGIQAIMAMRKYLRSRPYDTYVQCDSNTVAQAERLLRLLGFAPTEEEEIDMRNKQAVRVWKWQR